MPKLRLLIIEDDLTSAKLMQVTLARLGYEVTGVAGNGIDAIRLSQETQPDLLMMDINLPGEIDGIQTIELIRLKQDIPVIYVTANTEDETISQAIKTNPIGYLVKPYSREHLKTMVEMGIHKHRLENEIRQSKELLTVTLENIGDGVLVVNSEGIVVLHNDAAGVILGLDASSFDGKTVGDIFPNLYDITLAEEANPGDSQPGNRTTEVEWSGGNGYSLILEQQITRIEGKIDAPATFVVTFRDVTARRMESKRLVKLNEELEERVESRTLELRRKNLELEHEITIRLEAQRELQEALEKEKILNQFQANIVTTVSHEFRTPLTTIQSSGELIERALQRGADTEVIKKHIGQISRSAVALSNLINDVLIIEKMSASKHETHPEAVSPANFFHNLVEEFKIGMGKNHVIEYQHNVFPTTISTDPKLLRYIVSNLMSNAFKYSKTGTTVMLVVHIGQQALKIIVKDEGIGISEQSISLLFNTFYRDPSVVNIEGTGVGLSILKESVDLLNGKVDVQSKKGQGTTFTVTLPL